MIVILHLLKLTFRFSRLALFAPNDYAGKNFFMHLRHSSKKKLTNVVVQAGPGGWETQSLHIVESPNQNAAFNIDHACCKFNALNWSRLDKKSNRRATLSQATEADMYDIPLWPRINTSLCRFYIYI